MTVIAVVGADTYLGGRIADRLVARGRSVVALTPPPHSAVTAAPAAGSASGPGGGDRPKRSPGAASSLVGPAVVGPGGGDRPERSSGAASSVAERVAAGDAVRGARLGAVAAGERAEVAIEDSGPEAVAAGIVAGAAGRQVAAVLHAEVDEASCVAAPLTSLTLDEWHDRAARPVVSALWTARAAFEVLGDGGTLAFVCPSVSMTGTAGLVPLATAGEAVRLLAKSAARRWGSAGITVNVFAPRVDACSPHGRGAGRPAVNAAAFDEDDIDAADEIASLLAYLADPGSARLTGATLGTDGGELMAP